MQQTPLAGFRVLDLTNVLAGPFCCHQLAHMGAEVIKVEVPGSGDLARQLGADPDLNQTDTLMGVSFLAQNAGKKSITVNLKHPQGKNVLKRLVQSADVLVENFRPGVMDRLELGYETLKAENPGLVYCAISGFGQDGSMRNLPAYDQIIQGMSGLMSITGDPETAPYRVGYPVSDTIGGLTAALAIAGALAGRSNNNDDGCSAGCFIDVSMLEATIATMGWVISNYLIAGRQPQAYGNDNFTASPSGTFVTGEGLLNIAANKQEQFEAVCQTLAREDLITDNRFAERQARLDNRELLKSELEKTLAQKPAQDWQSLLNTAGVPCGCVLDVSETLALEQISERGMIGQFDNVPGVDRDIRLVRTGFKINGQAPKVDEPPPRLSQHTDQILIALGFSELEIRQLYETGAI